MLRYPVLLERDTNDTVLVSFPDFPEAHTFGDDEHEALTRAADLLQDVLADYIENRRDVPRPSKAKRRAASLILPVLPGDAGFARPEGGPGTPSRLSHAADRPFARSAARFPPGSDRSGLCRPSQESRHRDS
jgi:predicted RNase H-like HicB family nuclease